MNTIPNVMELSELITRVAIGFVAVGFAVIMLVLAFYVKNLEKK